MRKERQVKRHDRRMFLDTFLAEALEFSHCHFSRDSQAVSLWMTALELVHSPPRKQGENTATRCDPKITQVMSVILSSAVILPKRRRSRRFF